MKAVFVAATGQNVGKTTTCLGLVSGLKKKYASVAFQKPIGQEHIELETGEHVDKDVVLFKSHFDLKDPYAEMSPVLFPRGFTRDFLDGSVDHKHLVEKIKSSFSTLSKRSRFTVVEGTGHIGVGSIVDLNNAQVAHLLDIPIILVAPGGLGSSFDELALNIALCKQHGAKVAGVILNRVLGDKREMILDYVPKALKRWNVPLLGAVPFNSFLSMPTMSDFELLFQTKMVAGVESRLRHFQHIRLVATAVEMDRTEIAPNQLIITGATREDIILATLTRFWDLKIAKADEELHTGLILTGSEPPKSALLEQIRKTNIPTLYVPVNNFVAMKMINTHTAKIKKDDSAKIEEAIKVVENHIDFETLEKALQR